MTKLERSPQLKRPHNDKSRMDVGLPANCPSLTVLLCQTKSYRDRVSTRKLVLKCLKQMQSFGVRKNVKFDYFRMLRRPVSRPHLNVINLIRLDCQRLLGLCPMGSRDHDCPGRSVPCQHFSSINGANWLPIIRYCDTAATRDGKSSEDVYFCISRLFTGHFPDETAADNEV